MRRVGRLLAGSMLVGLACQKDLLFGPGPASAVLVAPDTVFLQVSDTTELSGVVVDSAGSALLELHVTWTSGDPAVATVDAAGMVVAKSLGSVDVTAAYEALRGLAVVIVEPPPALGFDPADVTFTASVGGGNPSPQTVEIVNAGGADLTGLSLGAISYDPGASGWLAVELSGSEEPATLTLNATTIPLTTAGTFTAGVPVLSDVATNSPLELIVSLVMTPGQPAQLVKAAGDNQIVVAGVPAPIAPTVLVRDAFGNPRPGVQVVFTVSSGNGGVTGAIATSDAQGFASVGSWTLQTDATSPSGASPGRYPNTLQASATGVGTTTFTGSAIYSFATHVQPVFSASCTFSVCHRVGVVPPDLTPGAAHAAIVGVPTPCTAGVNRVEPGQVEQSALMQLMDGIAVGGCVRPMPPLAILSDSLRNVVRSWIRNNALNN